MKSLVIAATAVVALATSATAADLPAKPIYKAPAVAPAFNWTGYYVGANAGYSWGRSNNDWNVFAPNFTTGSAVCVPAGSAFCLSGRDTDKLNGAIGGVQAGYNWQTGSFLAGIETDIDLSGQKGSQTFVTQFPTFFGFSTGTASAAYTEKLQWLGTLRGRIGVAADRVLFYATGGLAYGSVATAGSATATGFLSIFVPPAPPCPGPCPVGNWNNGVTEIGWTVGAGIERAVIDNWSIRAEYLYVDLGSFNTTFPTLPGCFGNTGVCTNAAAGIGTINSRISDHIFRVGVNYRFGGPSVESY